MPRQIGRHFPNRIFKCIILNESVLVAIKMSQKFVCKGQIDNIPILVQIVAWRQKGDKPLPEQMLTLFTSAYMRHKGEIN